jgi:hypothetical protein
MIQTFGRIYFTHVFDKILKNIPKGLNIYRKISSYNFHLNQPHALAWGWIGNIKELIFSINILLLKE